MKNRMGGEDNWDMKVRFLSTGVIAGTMTLGIYVMQAWKERQIRFWQNRNDYLSDQFQLLNHWLEIKSEGKSAAKYFLDRDYHHIAVYGMAELANRLLEDLEGSSVSVDYGIDRDACCSISRMDRIFSPEEELTETELVVVTPFHAFTDIKSKLERKLDCPIISIEEVIWSI